MTGKNKYGLILDEEFKELLPPLNDKDFRKLRKSILKDGCREPLVVWEEENILVDGYHRREICEKHKRPYSIVSKSFRDRNEVKEWMIMNQISRRNLNKFQLAEVALKFKPAIAEQAKKNKSSTSRALLPNSAKAQDTRKKLAKLAGIAPSTLGRVESILLKAANPLNTKIIKQVELLRQNAPGISINSLYNEIQNSKGKKKTLKPKAKPRKLPPELAKNFARVLVKFDKDVEQKFSQKVELINFYNFMSVWAKAKWKKLVSPQKQ
jgi:hypothetical protein